MSKEYFVTKISFRDDVRLIKDVFVYEYDGTTLYPGEIKDRPWMVEKTNAGYSITTLKPDAANKDKWIRGKPFVYINGYFSWGEPLPENITKRKTFVSYYHNDDQAYRERFENLFGDLIVSKSVDSGDIDSDNSDEYIKQLIQKEYLSDTTVLIVLLGNKTKCRKHIDWEISGALNFKIGDNYAGLLGIYLPSHSDYGPNVRYNPENVPKRLAANISSGYAKYYDWSEDRVKFQNWIEEAFARRNDPNKIVNKSITQMQRNTCE